MIVISPFYLNQREKNESRTRSEVLATILVDKFIDSSKIWHVGSDTNLKLPDIYDDRKKVGFEVVRCESQYDYIYETAHKELVKINYDYNIFCQIKSKKKNHVFNKIFPPQTVINNKIILSQPPFFHLHDYMLKDYETIINEKLKKLNGGQYNNCDSVSLIILSFYNGFSNKDQVNKAIQKIKEKYTREFKNIYYFERGGIYKTNGTNNLSILKMFNKNEFDLCVNKMKEYLKIDEYNI